jgi:hypothetical protein
LPSMYKALGSIPQHHKTERPRVKDGGQGVSESCQ